MTEENVTIKISKHAIERYVERTMDKNEKQEINLYINTHLNKIEEHIGKLYQYSDLFYLNYARILPLLKW